MVVAAACAWATQFELLSGSRHTTAARAPSRAALLTGCYPTRVSIPGVLFPGHKVGLHPDEITIADLLKSNDDISLVLINRKLDHDYSDGIHVLERLKADSATAAVPVMLITNYEDHQQAAVLAGAVPGFGKLALDAPETVDR